MASADIGGVQKISLHPNGYCAIGFTTEHWREQNSLTRKGYSGERTIRWQRERARPTKLSTVVKLQFPTDFLLIKQDVAARNKGKSHYCISPAPANQCIEVGIFSAVNGTAERMNEVAEWDKLLCWTQASAEEQFVIAGRLAPFDPASLSPILREFRSRLGIEDQDLPESVSVSEEIRCVAHTGPQDLETLGVVEFGGRLSIVDESMGALFHSYTRSTAS